MRAHDIFLVSFLYFAGFCQYTVVQADLEIQSQKLFLVWF